VAGSIWVTLGARRGDIGIDQEGKLVIKRGSHGRFVIGPATKELIDMVIQDLEALKPHAS